MPSIFVAIINKSIRVGLSSKILAEIYPSPGVGQGLGSEWYHNKKLKKAAIKRLHTKTYKPRIVKNHGSGYFFANF